MGLIKNLRGNEISWWSREKMKSLRGKKRWKNSSLKNATVIRKYAKNVLFALRDPFR